MKKKEKVTYYNNAFVIRLHNRRIIVYEDKIENKFIIHTIRPIYKGEDIKGLINVSKDRRLLETVISYSIEAMEAIGYGFASWQKWRESLPNDNLEKKRIQIEIKIDTKK